MGDRELWLVLGVTVAPGRTSPVNFLWARQPHPDPIAKVRTPFSSEQRLSQHGKSLGLLFRRFTIEKNCLFMEGV